MSKISITMLVFTNILVCGHEYEAKSFSTTIKSNVYYDKHSFPYVLANNHIKKEEKKPLIIKKKTLIESVSDTLWKLFSKPDKMSNDKKSLNSNEFSKEIELRKDKMKRARYKRRKREAKVTTEYYESFNVIKDTDKAHEENIADDRFSGFTDTNVTLEHGASKIVEMISNTIHSIYFNMLPYWESPLKKYILQSLFGENASLVYDATVQGIRKKYMDFWGTLDKPAKNFEHFRFLKSSECPEATETVWYKVASPKGWKRRVIGGPSKSTKPISSDKLEPIRSIEYSETPDYRALDILRQKYHPHDKPTPHSEIETVLGRTNYHPEQMEMPPMDIEPPIVKMMSPLELPVISPAPMEPNERIHLLMEPINTDQRMTHPMRDMEYPMEPMGPYHRFGHAMESMRPNQPRFTNEHLQMRLDQRMNRPMEPYQRLNFLIGPMHSNQYIDMMAPKYGNKNGNPPLNFPHARESWEETTTVSTTDYFGKDFFEHVAKFTLPSLPAINLPGKVMTKVSDIILSGKDAFNYISNIKMPALPKIKLPGDEIEDSDNSTEFMPAKNPLKVPEKVPKRSPAKIPNPVQVIIFPKKGLKSISAKPKEYDDDYREKDIYGNLSKLKSVYKQESTLSETQTETLLRVQWSEHATETIKNTHQRITFSIVYKEMGKTKTTKV